MRLHRFFVKSNINKEKINTFSSESLLHQMKAVFRFHDGIQFILFNGEAVDYVCEVVSLTKKELVFKVIETRDVKRYSQCNLTLAFSLIKKDNVEWIIQKGTEIGVNNFIPIVSERSEKKGFNIERAKRIIIEACEQSGRAEIPEVCEPKIFSDFIKEESRKIFALHTEDLSSGSVSDKNFTFDKNIFNVTGDVVACIGPEGGWSEKEIYSFKEKGAIFAKLNSPVLRAETAAVAVSTLFLIK